jgi:hypothetical protein
MATVWLTYAWDDNEDRDVDFIAQELEKAGVEVKLDRWNIQAGKRLWEQIEDFILDEDKCDAWVLYATPNSLGSEACKEEYAYALDRALDDRGDTFPVIGLLPGPVDDGILPAGIRTRLYVSTSDRNWKERIQAAAEGRDPSVSKPEVEPYQIQEYHQDGAYIVEVRPRAGTLYPFVAGVPLREKDDVGPVGSHPFLAIPGEPESPPSPGGRIYRVDGEGEAQYRGEDWYIVRPHKEATPRRSYYLVFQSQPSRLLFGAKGDSIWIEHLSAEPATEKVRLDSAITFEVIGDMGIAQSESYRLYKEDLEYIFEENEVQGEDIQSKIENHEHISIEPAEDRRVKMHFWTVDGTDDQWVFDITMPPDADLIVPPQVADVLEDKEPIEKDT